MFAQRRFIPWICCSVVSAMGLSSWAESSGPDDGIGDVIRPAYAGRVVRAFDFEEMYTNPLPVPRGWVRAQHDPNVPRDRPGFPIWNRAALDYQSPSQSGIGTVHLPISGGSTSLILRHGELTVFPKADYLISARVRTLGLIHAKTRLVAVMIDQQGNEIERSRVTTGLINTRGSWEMASVFIEGSEANAAFVRIELQVLQPEQQPRDRRVKPFTVWEQDFSGGAWFDDIVVAQVPMIGLTTGTVGNIVAGDVPPKLQMTVRDITGDDLTTMIRVFDSSGVLIDQYTAPRGSQRLGEHWTPELPGFGWYQAIFDVMSGGMLVGRQELDFIWEPPRRAGSMVVSHGQVGRRRAEPSASLFALSSSSLSENLLSAIPDLVSMTGVKTLKMRSWEVESELEDLEKGSAMVNAIDEMIGRGVKVSLGLGAVPMDLADQAAIDHDDIFGFLIDHPTVVLPVLGPFWDRYGQMISEWQLGVDVNEDDAEKLAEELSVIAHIMDPYVPDTVLNMPWAIDRPFEAGVFDQSVRLVVEDDPSLSESAFPDMVEQWAQGGNDSGVEGFLGSRSRLSIVHHGYPKSSDGTKESVWSRVGWLGRRAINAWWAAKVTSSNNQEIEIVLGDPWTVELGRRGRVMPGPELLVWRTLVDYLGGRQAVQELSLVPGVRMLLCSARSGATGAEESSEGALIIWLDEPSLETVHIELPLSMGTVQVVDLFGNSFEVPMVRETALQLPIHRVEVTRTPQIITHVQSSLVQFLSNIELTPDRLDATSGTHKHELIIRNPWSYTVRGRVYIVEPGGYSEPGGASVDRSWEIKPRVVDFSITAGLEKRFALDLSYSAAQLAGMKDLIFDVELFADQDYGLMRIKRQIELGTDDLQLDLTFRRVDEDKVEVHAVVTNLTDQPMMVDLVAIAPRNSRRESTISVIEPNKQGERVFLFDQLVSGDQVVMSARVPELNIHINKAVALP